jgi:hypothetical protein
MWVSPTRSTLTTSASSQPQLQWLPRPYGPLWFGLATTSCADVWYRVGPHSEPAVRRAPQRYRTRGSAPASGNRVWSNAGMVGRPAASSRGVQHCVGPVPCWSWSWVANGRAPGRQRADHRAPSEVSTAEQSCCSFVTWNVTAIEGRQVLYVTAPSETPEAVVPTGAMFGATTSSARPVDASWGTPSASIDRGT